MQRRDFFKGLATFVTALVVSGRIPQAAKAAEPEPANFNAKVQDVFISSTSEVKDVLESAGYDIESFEPQGTIRIDDEHFSWHDDAITRLVYNNYPDQSVLEEKYGKLYEVSLLHCENRLDENDVNHLFSTLRGRGFYPEVHYDYVTRYENGAIRAIDSYGVTFSFRSLNPETARIISERIQSYQALPDTERGYVTPFYGLHNDRSDPYGR